MISVSLLRSLRCETRSNAFDRSENITSTWLLLFIPVAKSWIVSTSCVTIQSPHLKPCWCGHKILCLLINTVMNLRMMCSRSLRHMHVRARACSIIALLRSAAHYILTKRRQIFGCRRRNTRSIFLKTPPDLPDACSKANKEECVTTFD